MSAPRGSGATFYRVWGAPLAIAVSTLAGLLSALPGTGAWHGLAWRALTVPVAVVRYFAWRARPRGAEKRRA